MGISQKMAKDMEKEAVDRFQHSARWCYMRLGKLKDLGLLSPEGEAFAGRHLYVLKDEFDDDVKRGRWMDCIAKAAPLNSFSASVADTVRANEAAIRKVVSDEIMMMVRNLSGQFDKMDETLKYTILMGDAGLDVSGDIKWLRNNEEALCGNLRREARPNWLPYMETAARMHAAGIDVNDEIKGNRKAIDEAFDAFVAQKDWDRLLSFSWDMWKLGLLSPNTKNQMTNNAGMPPLKRFGGGV